MEPELNYTDLFPGHRNEPRDPARPVHGPEPDRSATLGRIRELEEAARSIREKGFTARSFETIASAGADLEEMFRRQERMEEAHLFPELMHTDPELVRGFTEEHRAARFYFAALRSTIRDIEGGRLHGGSVGDLLRTIGKLVALLRRHIIREGDALANRGRHASRGEGPALHGH